eukprot:gb/GFBE01023502.1/.p1 GENE.gb/GFBE01023502.1/~~gb/GFBE01023502.1/.p1  ORF type:complete len:159 (+),score=38.94 gb/GFBE01023502.1/:1-477(+)
MARARASRVLAACMVLGAAVWTLGSLTSFCGAPGPVSRHSLTACKGWRLDKIEVGPGGIGQLVCAEGFYIGEKDMKSVLNKQGRRYRMRPFAEERAKGKNVPGITQIGPFKIHLEQMFGGSCGDVDAVRPQGYTGCAGVAGFGDELPTKKQGYGALPK